MAVWRNDWEKNTGKRSWGVVKKGEVTGLLGEFNEGPQRSSPSSMPKHANEEADAETSRDDTGKGVDFGGLFDPGLSDTPGAPPTINPVSQLQAAQTQLSQQVAQLSQQMGQLLQSFQSGQQGKAQAQQPAQQQPQAQAQPPAQPAAPPTAEPTVGPDGLVQDPQGGQAAPPRDPSYDMSPDMDPSQLDLSGLRPEDLEALQDQEDQEELEDEDPGVPPGLEFDPDNEEAYIQNPKRALPPRPGEAFSTPGSEIAAGTPNVMRMETSIKTSSSDARITPHELLGELTQAYGHGWLDWEPETLRMVWEQDHGGQPLEEGIFHKILALQVLLLNTNGFWSDHNIFRDVILVFNGAEPLHDEEDTGESISPAQIAYGVFVAAHLAPFEKIDMQQPGEDVVRYVAVIYFLNGLTTAMFPLKWAQPYLSALLHQQGVKDAPKPDEVGRRTAQILEVPWARLEHLLNPSNPLDTQAALQRQIKDYVAAMEGGS